MVGLIMDEQQRLVAKPAVAIAFELQRCLNGRITEHPHGTIEGLPILMQSLQEEVGMVEACDGETRQLVLHVAGEVLTILPLELLSGRRQRVIIEYRRYVGIVFVVVLQIPVGIEQPV